VSVTKLSLKLAQNGQKRSKSRKQKFVQRMQKALTQMNIQLTNVISESTISSATLVT